MEEKKIYEKIKEKFISLIKENNLLKEEITVKTKVLTAEEAIGNPNRQDYPLIKGKEKLMQADYKGFYGQAFTDMPGNFRGTVEEVINLPLDSNYNRGVFIAALNAIMSFLGKGEGFIHCKDEEPESCSKELVDYIKKTYGDKRIALIGFQPAFLESLSKNFDMRVLDLDKDRIGTKEYGVLIEDGEKKKEEVLNWCEIIVSTGSTIVNQTIENYMFCEKPTIFYGTTIAGTAKLLGLEKFCEYSK